MEKRRVVITGLGAITSAGLDVSSFWNSVSNGKSGISPITKFDTSRYDTKIAGEIKGFNTEEFGLNNMLSRKLDEFTQYSLVTTRMAIDDSNIDLDSENKNKIGVFVGNCIGGVCYSEKQLYNLYKYGHKEVSPYQSISWFNTATQGQVSIYYKLKGYSKTFVADRISSDVAIGYAYKSILQNKIDVCFAIGTESAIAPFGFLDISNDGLLSKQNSNPEKTYSPFDLNRSGLVYGEGSGTLVIEELSHALKRDAKIYGEIIGFESNCDGEDYKNHDKTGNGYKAVMESCINKAGLSQNDIDYVNLDGCALKEDDVIETNVIKQVFGERVNDIALSCPKSVFGCTYGASGALDMIINCMVIINGVIPPTINYKTPDKQCDLNYTPNVAVKRSVNVAMQVARGRGGINSALLIRKYAV